MSNNNQKPNISVIMGIYNCAGTVGEAIESILAQTYTDWEFIICDDGSVDSTYDVAKEYRDKYPDKIKLLKNKENRGLNYTLNRCLKEAEGNFIARMDGDDKCDPKRFEIQLAVFDQEPELSIVSTDMGYFNDTGIWGEISHQDYPVPINFLYESPFCHAPCLVRKEAFDAVGGYTEGKRYLRVEDYDLWIKMYKKGYRGKNIHQKLYFMRDDSNAYSRRVFANRLNEAYIKCKAIRELHLPIWGYVHALLPLIKACLPNSVYHLLHKIRLQRSR